jgi:hypothetical protein
MKNEKMRAFYLLVFIPLLLLMGCQSLGDHINCSAEVDRTVPAQTQQRYLRTDTKCTSSGSGIATPTTTRGDQYIVNTDRQTNCTSTPVYETIILNQAERDAAYQQCRGRVNSNRANSQLPAGYTPTSSNQKTPEEIRRYDLQRSKCDSIKDNDLFLACMREIRQPAAPIQPQKSFSDTEWQEKLNKNKNNPAYMESMKKIKCQEMGYPAGTSEWKKCVASFPN